MAGLTEVTSGRPAGRGRDGRPAGQAATGDRAELDVDDGRVLRHGLGRHLASPLTVNVYWVPKRERRVVSLNSIGAISWP